MCHTLAIDKEFEVNLKLIRNLPAGWGGDQTSQKIMSFSHKYPVLLSRSIAENPATQEELNVLDTLVKNDVMLEGLEIALWVDKQRPGEEWKNKSPLKTNRVILHLSWMLTERVPGSLDALERISSLYRKCNLPWIGATGAGILRNLKNSNLMELVPRVADILKVSPWGVLDAFYDRDIHDRVIHCSAQLDLFISRTICDCLDNAQNSTNQLRGLAQCMPALDYWKWDNKTDVLDTLFSSRQDGQWLLAFASYCIPISRSDPIRQGFADKIAAWAFYGIRQEQIPEHRWLPVEFPPDELLPLEDNNMRPIKVSPRRENTVAVEEFLCATTNAISGVVHIEPIAKLVMTYFAS